MKSNRSYWMISTGIIVLVFALVASTPLLLAQPGTNQSDTYIDVLAQIFRYVQKNYVEEVDPQVIFEGAATGLVESLEDPYSYYLTASDMVDMGDTTQGNFGGVGLYISKYVEFDPTVPESRYPYIYVVSPIEGTPAYKAGIHAGDYILKIEGESTEAISSDEAANRLRGVPGTKVTVTILRGKDFTFDLTLERAIIEIPTVRYGMIGSDIGYLRIIQFTPFTVDRVREAVSEMNRGKGMAGLVIDVRSNPGGLLNSVVRVADFFLDEGIIVGTKSRIASENEEFTAKPSTIIPMRTPIVVLIDRGSASAAEILAGALKDSRRAVVIGETSFGKGSVQNVIPLPSGGGLRLTTSRYYTPSGTFIDKIGVTPNIPVSEPELTEEEQKALKKLLEENLVVTFVADHPAMENGQIDRFVRDLISDGFTLAPRILKRLVRNEYYRKMDSPPIYDLEFDLALQEALRVLGADSSGQR